MPEIESYIERKTMLYKTGVEYGDYTMNFVQGCSHGCKYPCYAFLLKKRFGQISDYDEWCKPQLVENTLSLLEKEIPRLKAKIESVHLCFSTDPFMYGYQEIEDMALFSIKKLNAAGIKCTVLTKGILPFSLSELSEENEYGITLVTMNEAYREKMEPGAAPITERLNALRALHDAGCKTWISMEPYPTPNLLSQKIDEVLEAVSFVDKIIFGRANYSTEISAYKEHKSFYNQMAQQVINFCEKRDIQYHIKDKTIT